MRRSTRLYAVVVSTTLAAGAALGAGPIGSAVASGPADWSHQGGPAGSGPVQPGPKVPVMTGGGGAVASADDVATQVGIDVLRKGGNAADAAVAAAATLGVTEPYSAGIGGGGFLVYYNAKARRVQTIDGRETAPATFTSKTPDRP